MFPLLDAEQQSTFVSRSGRRGAVRASKPDAYAETGKLTEDQRQLIKILTDRGGGSFLRGWFIELDCDGDLNAKYGEFVKACARVGFEGDVQKLMGLDDDLTTLSLAEVHPEAANLFNRFRDWAKESFGGFAETFSALDATGRGQITVDMFISACQHHHFQGSNDELAEIFKCLDNDFTGYLSINELIFLEKDNLVREQARIAETKKQKEKHLKLMAWAYDEDVKSGVAPTHRRAARPWLAGNFDDLPMLINRRRVEWQHSSYQKSLEARVTFVRHLRNTFGNEVRAWRVGLDPQCKFAVDAKVINRYCRKADLKIDTAALWKSLDKDCDSLFHLEELCVRAADILATFQKWAVQKFGSCADMWHCPNMQEARYNSVRDSKWSSGKKIRFRTFTDVMRACECPFSIDPDLMILLLSSLDLYGCGFIELADLEWLDKYAPPEWLCSEPDVEAWNEMRDMMLRIYKHPLKAWRNLLDADNSNNVSWMEFKEACQELQFKGNVGGAWRVLNHHLTSAISMHEYDAESAFLLESFKEWADTHFGSVRNAFKALDEHRTGHVTFSDLRRACQKLKFSGDVRLLFDCLDTDGRMHGNKRCISFKDVDFLDDWQGDRNPEEAVEDSVVNQILAKEAAKTLQPPTSSSLPALPTRLLRNKTQAASFLAHGDGGPNPGDILPSTRSRVSSISESDRLRRTYGCSSSFAGKTPKCVRQLKALPSEVPQKDNVRQKTVADVPSSQSLPWLHKWMAIDRKMQHSTTSQARMLQMATC